MTVLKAISKTVDVQIAILQFFTLQHMASGERQRPVEQSHIDD